MSNWLPIDQSQMICRMPDKEGTRGNGVKLTVSLSPYDVPTAYRAYFNHEKNKFIIEFCYIADEKTKVRALSEHVQVAEGMNSGRLYLLSLDVNSLDSNTVLLNIEKLFDNEADVFGCKVSEMRKQISKKVLQTVDKKMVSELVSAH